MCDLKPKKNSHIVGHDVGPDNADLPRSERGQNSSCNCVWQASKKKIPLIFVSPVL